MPAFKPLKSPAAALATGICCYRALKPAVCLHGPLLLRRSSPPFASLQTLKITRGSFDQALWRKAFVVRALKPAVCLHRPLLLGLPFARLQTVKIPRSSFDQALWRQAFVVRALKPAVCLHSLLCYGVKCGDLAKPDFHPQTLGFTSIQTPRICQVWRKKVRN